MTGNKENLDGDLLSKVSGKLAADLKALYEPALPVPAEVDRAVMDRAHRQLVRLARPHRLLRWAASVAAAAVIILVFTLNHTKEPGATTAKSYLAVVQADIDRNGRVDILDAFKLARHVKSAEEPEIKWDINNDGMVNRHDIDFVAFAAVRLDKGV